jgi:hypothetical protein
MRIKQYLIMCSKILVALPNGAVIKAPILLGIKSGRNTKEAYKLFLKEDAAFIKESKITEVSLFQTTNNAVIKKFKEE